MEKPDFEKMSHNIAIDYDYELTVEDFNALKGTICANLNAAYAAGRASVEEQLAEAKKAQDEELSES